MAKTTRKTTRKNSKKVEEQVQENPVVNEETEAQEVNEKAEQPTNDNKEPETNETKNEVENKKETETKTQNESKKKQEETPKETVVDVNSEAYILEAMKRTETPDDAYKNFKDTGILKDFVIGIKQYNDFITGPKKDNPEEYVAASYRFYNLLMKHLSDEKLSVFKKKLNLLLKLLNRGKKGTFNIVNFLKYDHFWKYGQKTRVSYYLLVTFLDGIADPKTRKKELKRLSIDKLADYVPEKLVLNLKRYLNV